MLAVEDFNDTHSRQQPPADAVPSSPGGPAGKIELAGHVQLQAAD
jgi:hypothetical protein